MLIKQGRRARRLGLAAAMVLGLSPLAGAHEAPAQEKPAQENKMQLEETETLAAFLKRLEGKAVRLRLAGGGEEVAGKLARVTAELAYVSELSGREFFDAVVRIDQIAAVSVQVRTR